MKMEEKKRTQSFKRKPHQTGIENENGTVKIKLPTFMMKKEWNGVEWGRNGGRKWGRKLPEQCRKKAQTVEEA